MSELEELAARSDRMLTLYGTEISSLPDRIFSLYAYLLHNYSRTRRLVKSLSHNNIFYNKSKNCYMIHNSTDAADTQESDSCRISRQQVKMTLGRFACAGINYFAITLAHSDRPEQSGRLVLTMDHMLLTYYNAVARFVKANPVKYKTPPCFDIRADEEEKLKAFLATLSPALSDEERSARQAQYVNARDEAGKRMALQKIARLRRVAVFDTEHSGGYPIQFAGVLLEQEEGHFHEIRRLDMYIRLPQHRGMDPVVTELTGITDVLLHNKGLREEQAAPMIEEFLSEADAICGQAIINDTPVVQRLLSRQGIHKLDGPIRERLLDTSIIVRQLFDLPNIVKLERAAELANVLRDDDDFHDARTDAAVTGRVLDALLLPYVRRFGRLPLLHEAMLMSPQKLEFLEDLPQSLRTPAHYTKSASPARQSQPDIELPHDDAPLSTLGDLFACAQQ